MSCHYGLSLIHLQDINFKYLAFEIQEPQMRHRDIVLWIPGWIY